MHLHSSQYHSRKQRSVTCAFQARDVNGYPLQGYDLVSERPKAKPKDTLSDLVKLLQEANEREEAANQRAEHWHRVYLEVKQEHLAFKYEDLCSSCKRHKDETELSR